MKSMRKNILLILAAALVIISGILPLTNIFAGPDYELPSQTVVDNYEEPQPAEKSLPSSTASAKESDQTVSVPQQPGPKVEQPGTTAPEPNRDTQQTDLNLQQPVQGEQEPNTTPQPAQQSPQSYPGVHYPWFHQMDPDYQPDYEWYDDDRSDWEDNRDKDRRHW